MRAGVDEHPGGPLPPRPLSGDEVEAFKFYVLAAEQGIGVPYDRGTNRVVRGGDGPSIKLAKRLSRAQLDDGQARAKAFKPLSGPLKL